MFKPCQNKVHFTIRLRGEEEMVFIEEDEEGEESEDEGEEDEW